MAFWRNLVAEYFAPSALMRWCVSSYGSGSRQPTGVFPQVSQPLSPPGPPTAFPVVLLPASRGDTGGMVLRAASRGDTTWAPLHPLQSRTGVIDQVVSLCASCSPRLLFLSTTGCLCPGLSAMNAPSLPCLLASWLAGCDG